MKTRGPNNAFCCATDLTNEASVESFFVLRLLKHLGYEDHEILTKHSIDALATPKGRKKELYKPDFVIAMNEQPRWLIDAKSTEERIEQVTHQCAGYALLLNRKFKNRPCHFYMLTNGLLTRVYQWDQEEPILSLRFSDFAEGNKRFETLTKLLSATAARQGWEEERERR